MIETTAEVFALLLACWAGWKSVAQRPNYDWKKIFRRVLGEEDLELSVEENHPSPLLDWKDIPSEKFTAYLQRKFAHLILFDQDGRFGEQYAQIAQIRHYLGAKEGEDIASLVAKKSDRLLFFAAREGVMELLTMLHQYPGMRDRLFAVVLVDPQVDEVWIKENFTQEAMDAEANHAIPYFLISIEEEEFVSIVEPPTPATGWRSIEVIDLREESQGKEPEEIWLGLWVLMGKL